MLYRAGQRVLAAGRKAMVGAFAGYVGRIGADPADADDVHMRKALISGAALAVMPLAFLWTGFLAAFGEVVAAAVPFSYAALTLIGLLIFAITRHYDRTARGSRARGTTLRGQLAGRVPHHASRERVAPAETG